MTTSATEAVRFSDLGLPESILSALADVGYESPSPIQAACIPALLEGGDLLGQAQTGTGKTGAFALPILSRIDIARREPQALVLVPTRELAIQVAEAFQKYASHMPGFHVLPIYGGQSYTPQLNALKRGTHVVVATPGRVIDHLERGTLDVSTVSCVVLDEADEMLQMGFVDPIESILARLPESRQIALYSATMAPAVRRIADRHLRSPRVINIKSKTSTATNIRQRYWMVEGTHKLDALTRILEVETFDAILVFTRTKQSTVELAEKLEARGFGAAALNGDIQQNERERTVQALKSGKIDIIVATDVVVDKEWDYAVTTGEPERRAQPHERIVRGRTSDGVAGVGAKPDETQVCGDCGGRAARGAGRDPFEVVGVSGDAGNGTLGEVGRERPLRHVGFGEHDRARGAQPRDHVGIGVGQPALQCERAGGRLEATCLVVVLDDHRHAVQGLEAAGAPVVVVEMICVKAGFGVDHDDGVQPHRLVKRADAGEILIDECPAGEFAAAQRRVYGVDRRFLQVEGGCRRGAGNEEAGDWGKQQAGGRCHGEP